MTTIDGPVGAVYLDGKKLADVTEVSGKVTIGKQPDVTKTPYWLTEDERPGPDDQMYYSDYRGKDAGVKDLYGFATVKVARSSNAGYDGAWLEMEGRVDLGRDWTPDDVDRSVVAVVTTPGSITGNYSKAELVRLRNAIDELLADMEWKPGTAPPTARICRGCQREIHGEGLNFRSAAAPNKDLGMWYCDADCADGDK